MMLFLFNIEHLAPPECAPVEVRTRRVRQVTAGQRARVLYIGGGVMLVEPPVLLFPHWTTLPLTFSHGYLMAKPTGAATHLLNNDPIWEWGMEIGSQSAKNRASERILASLTHGTVCVERGWHLHLLTASERLCMWESQKLWSTFKESEG